MNVDKALEAIFPPATILYHVLAWWQQQPDGPEGLPAGLGEFFGAPEAMPDQADPEQAPEMIRFLEWVLLDRESAGGTPAVRYAAAAPAADKAQLEDVLGNRHDAWRVEAVAGDGVTLAPMGGGEPLTVSDSRFVADLQQGEWVVGRFYPWRGSWLPSISVFFVAGIDEGPGSAQAMTALMAQRVFFAPDTAVDLDPERAREEIGEFLKALKLETSLEALTAMAREHEDPQSFLEAFAKGTGRAIFASEKEGTRLGALLLNLWYHTPRPELDGKTPAQADAAHNVALADALERLYGALAEGDEAEAIASLDPEGELALVHDLWGMPGLRMLLDWEGPVEDPQILSQEPDMGAMRLELMWKGPDGADRGATVWLVERPEGYVATEAVPELGDGELVNPAYRSAQEKGVLPPWRSGTDDAVEQKLRNAVVARKLPMLEQATMIKAWRMVTAIAERDAAAPEAWAAAVEAFFRASLGQDVSVGQVADMYGAKKTLVKERFAALNEALVQRS